MEFTSVVIFVFGYWFVRLSLDFPDSTNGRQGFGQPTEILFHRGSFRGILFVGNPYSQ
jgi:hypothetical protein